MILRSLWWRPMRKHPLRTLATVLGVAIGVASVVSTVLASRAAVASMGADVEVIAGKARIEVTRPGGVAVEDLDALRPLCRDALLTPVIDETALAPGLGSLVRVLGVDLLVDAGVRDVPLEVEGGDLADARERMLLADGAAISRALADKLGLTTGDRLELVVQSRRVDVEVAAIASPERFPAAWERVVVVDVAHAQELFARAGRFDRLELLPRGDLTGEALAARARDLLPAGYRVEPVTARRAEGERMVQALEFNLTALAGVSILVGIVLVATALATSVVQRRSHIALLRSLGASRAQLAGALLVEAGTIGLVGGALGVLLGWLGAGGAVASVHSTVLTVADGVLPGEVRLEPIWALLGLALGFFASTLAAVLPLREALRTPPVQGLRGEHPDSVARRPWKARAVVLVLLGGAAAFFAQLPPLGDRPVWALVSALLILSTLLVLSGPLIDLFAALRPRGLGVRGVPLRLAQAALEAGRRRAAWAAGAVGMAVGLAVAMTAMVGSFRTSVVEWTEQAMPSDLFVRPLATEEGAPAGRIAPEVADITRRVLGERNVDPFHQSKAYFRDEAILLGGAEFSVVAREGGVPFLDERRGSAIVFDEARTRGEVVVNEPFARRFGVERGDWVEIETPQGPARRRIAGVYRDYSGHTGRVVLDLPDYLAHYPDDGPRSLSCFVPPDADIEERREELAAALGGFAVEILNNQEVRAQVLRVFERTFAVTVALQLISSIVAGIAVVAVLTALIHERRKELAVVRVLGASKAQLFVLVLGEALLLGLAGAVGGWLVGLTVGYVLVTVVNVQSFGWTLEFAPPAAVYWTALAVVPACLVAGFVPALLSLRNAPREALHATG